MQTLLSARLLIAALSFSCMGSDVVAQAADTVKIGVLTDMLESGGAKMREISIRDVVMRNASIRPDGSVIDDMYLYQVKSPAEAKGAWDYLKLLSTISAQQAFRPMDTACPLVK